VMALEDAVVLADALTSQSDPASAFAKYESLRRWRATRVQHLSWRNGRIYHMRPPLAWARDAVLRFAPGARLMAGFDWLYGWQPPQ
jgi:salicylate hydroxylase